MSSVNSRLPCHSTPAVGSGEIANAQYRAVFVVVREEQESD